MCALFRGVGVRFWWQVLFYLAEVALQFSAVQGISPVTSMLFMLPSLCQPTGQHRSGMLKLIAADWILGQNSEGLPALYSFFA